MSEFYLYKSRYNEHVLTPKTREAWDFLVARMENDNGVTEEEAKRDGYEYEGSYEVDWRFMDDGGEIRVIVLTEDYRL